MIFTTDCKRLILFFIFYGHDNLITMRFDRIIIKNISANDCSNVKISYFVSQ